MTASSPVAVPSLAASQTAAQQADHRQSSAQFSRRQAWRVLETVTSPFLHGMAGSVADRWKRMLWRLTEQQDEMWKGLMRAAARPKKRGNRVGRHPPPTLCQLACRHPPKSRWQGANQWAEYEKCLLCKLRLKHTPRANVLQSPAASSSSEGGPKKGAQRASPPAPGYVREPPLNKVEEFMDRALQPILRAQALQQEGMARQQQMMDQLATGMQQQQTFLASLLNFLPAAARAGGRGPESSQPPAAPATSLPGDWHSLPPGPGHGPSPGTETLNLPEGVQSFRLPVDSDEEGDQDMRLL